MRVQIGCRVKARAGDSVRFLVVMPDDAINVDCGLFSYVKGYEPAPHVERHKARHLTDGKPMFVNPKVLRLHSERKIGEIEIEADERCTFVLMQDVDLCSDPLATTRIWKNGKRYSTVWRGWWQAGQRLFSAVRQIVGRRQG